MGCAISGPIEQKVGSPAKHHSHIHHSSHINHVHDEGFLHFIIVFI
jgi:hypothetical protein